MAVIVKHRKNGKVFVLIGTGYGAYKSARPSLIGGSLFPSEDEGEISVAAVSDENGEIQWFYTNDLKVIEIDGLAIQDVLAAYGSSEFNSNKESDQDVCPACKSKLSLDDNECPSCGLVFQKE